MTDRLCFTGDEAADRFLVEDPFALLIGFALDQRVPVPKAFMGPWVLRERLGSLEPSVVAQADLEPIFRTVPAIHRVPAMMAKQVHALAVHIVEVYDGDADTLWLVMGAPHEAANTLEMDEETLAFLYPDGPKALPPELSS